MRRANGRSGSCVRAERALQARSRGERAPRGRSRSSARGRLIVTASMAASALWIAGCKPVGPDYVRPSLPIPAEYRHVAGVWKPAEPGDTLPRGRWWEMFGDRELDRLVERIDAGNLSIREAQARYAQAQAALRQARAGLFPVITGAATARRSRTFSGSSGAVGDYEIAADLSWEADVWGRVRRGIEAGQAQAQAAAADIESVRLAVTAALVENYVLLRTADQQTRLLDEITASFERSLTLTTNRYKAGVVAKSDVVQAQVQLRSAQAQRVDVGAQRAQLEHAIAVLIGVSPSELAIGPGELAVKLPDVPAGLPSELLQRRPDIAAAERRVAAANARIGVAQGALFPAVSLSAGAGISSTTLPDLLRAPTLFWALGATALQVLFDGGERRAITDQARAALDGEAAVYRLTVLNGFREVEDNLAVLRILDEEARLQADAVAAARESVKLTENRYRAGTAGILEVIVVQQALLANERAALGIRGRRLVAAVQLVRALGGGWDARELEASAAPP